MFKLFLGLLTCLALISLTVQAKKLTIHQNQVAEWNLNSSKEYQHPFTEVELWAEIQTPEGKKLLLPAFWRGGNVWSFRFSASQPGEYSYTTRCSDRTNDNLHEKKGIIQVLPYKGKNPLYINGSILIDHQREKLVHNSGKPFLWLADSWWFGMSKRISYSEFTRLVDDRVEKGFSVIQFAIGFACDILPFDDRDKNEAGFIWKEDLSAINPQYFEYTDRRISYLVENGLVPNIVGSWGYYIHTLGVERFKRHWNYLIARYGAYPVTWTLCGEAGLAGYQITNAKELLEKQRKEWSEVAAYIKENDPYHRLLTVHSGPNSGGHIPIESMDFVDFFMTQPGHNDFETLPNALIHLQKAQEMYPEKPVMAGEVCFEGMAGACKEKIQRYLFWSHLLSGSCGHSYGTDATWQFNSRKNKFGPSVSGQIWGNEPWEEAINWKGSLHVGIGKKILERYNWFDMQPHPEWISDHATVKEFMKPFCAGIPDKFRIIYFPRKVAPWMEKAYVLRMDKEKKYLARWTDPLSGTNYPAGEVIIDEQGRWEIPFAPILQDWLLIIETIN